MSVASRADSSRLAASVGSALVGITAALAVAQVVGSPPALTAVVAGAAWVRVLGPRVGWFSGVALVAIGWMFFATLTLVLTPMTPLPFAVVVAACWVGASAIAWRIERRWPLEARDRDRARASRAGVFGAATGTVVWLVSAVLGQVLPQGSGLSWAAYADSSLDVFELRYALEYNGIRSIGGNPRPVEHALTTSFASQLEPLDASATTFASDVATHGVSWVVLVALACFLAGATTAKVLLALKAPTALVGFGAALASLGLLAAPVTGLVFKRGQINAHVTWVIVFSVLVIMLSRRVPPRVALAALVAATALAMLCWTPFAAIPGVFALMLAFHNRHHFAADWRQTVLWIGLPTYAFAWGFIVHGYGNFLFRLGSDGTVARSQVTADAIYANPAWIPLTAGVIVGTLVLGLMVIRSNRRLGSVAVVAGGVLFGVAIPFIASRGGWTGELEYYPSRFISMAAVALAPVLIGLIGGGVAKGSAATRLAAGGTGLALVGLVIVAPAHPLVPKWGLTPTYLVTGQYFGTRAQMIDKVNSYGAEDEFLIAWDADPPYDFWVNYMLGVNEHVDRRSWSTGLRSSLRNYGVDTRLERLCDIGDGEDRPVIAYTRDPDLAAKVAAACPDEGIAIRLLGD